MGALEFPGKQTHSLIGARWGCTTDDHHPDDRLGTKSVQSNQRLSSFSITNPVLKMTQNINRNCDCGNGKRAGVPITGNDPNDAYVTSNEAFQRGFVQNLVSRSGLGTGRWGKILYSR